MYTYVYMCIIRTHAHKHTHAHTQGCMTALQPVEDYIICTKLIFTNIDIYI